MDGENENRILGISSQNYWGARYDMLMEMNWVGYDGFGIFGY